MKSLLYCLQVLVLFSFTACVSTKNVAINEADAAKLQGASLASSKREVPSFAVVTPGKATFGAFGAIGGAIAATMMISAGEKLVKTNGISDPADQIARELAQALAAGRGVKVYSASGSLLKGEPSVSEIAKAHPGADFVLDVRTVNWTLGYFPVNWGTYRVIYSVRMQLIDTKASRVVAEGFYARVPEKNDQSPGYDAMEANGASRLKQELQIAAGESVAHFKKAVLKL